MSKNSGTGFMVKRFLILIMICGNVETYAYFPTSKELAAYGADCVSICKALFKDQGHTAALTASSPWLVDQIAKHVPLRKKIRVLEVGSGPGTVTRKILGRLSPHSMLDVVEYNQDLFSMLCKNLGQYQNDRIHFYCSAIEEWKPKHATDLGYDLIISTVPRTQLPMQIMTKVLKQYERMLKPGGIFVSIMLIGARPVTEGIKKAYFYSLMALDRFFHCFGEELCGARAAVDDYHTVMSTIDEWEKTYFVPLETKLVSLNIPPVYVMSLCKKI